MHQRKTNFFISSQRYHLQQNICYPLRCLLPPFRSHSILSTANLLAHNNINQICYCGQISLQSAAVNCSFSDKLTPLGVIKRRHSVKKNISIFFFFFFLISCFFFNFLGGNIYFAGDGSLKCTIGGSGKSRDGGAPLRPVAPVNNSLALTAV